MRVLVFQHRIGERLSLDLREPGRYQAEWLPGEADGFDATVAASVLRGGAGVFMVVLHGLQCRGGRAAAGVSRDKAKTRAPKAVGPSAGEEEEPPVGCCRSGRCQSRSLRQHSHPARFAAGAGNLWRLSAHKGSPLFRRRAPAPNTVDPMGLLTPRSLGGQGVRRPSAIDGKPRSVGPRRARSTE